MHQDFLDMEMNEFSLYSKLRQFMASLGRNEAASFLILQNFDMSGLESYNPYLNLWKSGCAICRPAGHDTWKESLLIDYVTNPLKLGATR